MIRFVAALLVCCAALTGSRGAELDSDQIAELRRRLDELAVALDAGQTTEIRSLAVQLQRWARQQDASLPVDLICERALAFPTNTGARELRDSIRQLSDNLAALPTTPPSGADLDETRATLAQVLAGSEYHHAVQPGLWQRIAMRTLYWLSRIMNALNRIPGAERVASVMFYIAVALMLLPLLGAIGYLIWQRAKRRDLPQLEATGSVTALESPDTHRARAEDFLRQGQYLEALKQFHLAVLAALERRGLVVHDRTRTNWEYLAQLESKSAPPESITLLRALNKFYDRAVFGSHPCDQQLARQFGEQSTQLLKTVANGSLPS